MAIALDTLDYARRLREAGFTEQQAEGQARALAAAMTDALATKQDLRELETRLDARFAQVDGRFAQVDARIDSLERHLDTRLVELEKRVEVRFNEQGARLSEQGARFDGRLADSSAASSLSRTRSDGVATLKRIPRTRNTAARSTVPGVSLSTVNWTAVRSLRGWPPGARQFSEWANARSNVNPAALSGPRGRSS